MNEKSLRVLEFGKIIQMLVDLTSSPVGKEISRKLTPSTDFGQVMSMLDETTEGESFSLQYGNPPFGALHDIKDNVSLAKIGGTLSIKQILEVGDCLRSARNVKSFISKGSEVASQFPVISGLASAIFIDKELEDRISVSIIGESQISDNASHELKRIRREIENKHSAIRSKLESLIRSTDMQRYLQDAIVTIRQDRFVIPVKAEYKTSVKGLVHDQSSSGSTFYIEPYAVVELNNELKGLYIDESKEIERILIEFSGNIMAIADELMTNQNIMARIDFIFAKAKLSLQMTCTRPKLSDRKVMRMISARHPLIPKDKVVANTIHIGNGFSTLLITGPNTGGKTVTLKTIGLLSLMNQSGLHVPASSGSIMPVFEGIYADIGDEQSIEQSLSTFSSHMTNIVEIMNVVTKDSLALFDELGAGTDPTEGAALAMAILTKLHKYGTTTVATTHYSELKEFAIVNEGIENACVEFDINTLGPTYRLLIGIPGKSNAFEISRKLGLSNEIIDSAKRFVATEDIAFEDILSNIEENRIKAQMELDNAEQMKAEMEKLRDKLKEKEVKVTEQREKLLKDAREEARRVIKTSRDEADKVLREIKDVKVTIDAEQQKRLENARKSLKDRMGDLNEPIFRQSEVDYVPPKTVNIGDRVRIVNLGQEAIVATKPDSSGNLTVQAGIMKVSVKLKNLMLLEDSKEVRKAFTVSKTFESKASEAVSEVDLRGMNVDDASMELDKYIDNAILSNQNTLRVIHGKGTGALRAGLTEYFKRNKRVKSFRVGGYTEGGTGVTIIELK